MVGYSKSDQIGKTKKSQTEKNIDANAELDLIYKEMGEFDICQAKVHKNCLKVSKKSYGKKIEMTYIHKFKRIFYKKPENRHLLASYKHTLRGCLPCHIMLEADPKLTAAVFARERPE